MRQFQDDSLDGYTCPHVSSRKMLMILFIRECVATTLLMLRMLAESKHYYKSELLEPKNKKTKTKRTKTKTNDIDYLLYLQWTRLHNYCNISLLLKKKNREITK